ncbi:hypothetical protein I5E68_03340 [Novosphingobium sp. YJ-S2-02]|uniref:Uncharacterized protein n=1 Tax=Novosphingobium aureum TaxID=2792964 RepID=A0A931H9R9_9SPHN|nr:hypothetical protein [Novosphingobium aureum]MBH0111987.1 hypothetical protein [Novosphingobium aureum]
MIEALYVGILVVALVAWLVQGRFAPSRRLVVGVFCGGAGLGLVVIGASCGLFDSLDATASQALVLACALLAMLGVLVAVPALSEMIGDRFKAD